jgi:hypothetical protein
MKAKIVILTFLSVSFLFSSCTLPIPAAVPTTIPPTPTNTPAPELSISGSVVDKDTDLPIPNVLLILCQKDTTSSCIATDLAATTDANGKFSFPNIEPGNYAVLYSVTGNIPSDLTGKTLDYSPGSTSASPGPGNVNNLMKSLNIGSLDTCNAVYEIFNGNLVVSGYVYSDSMDLAFIFLSGDLIFVTVTDTPVTADLRIWDTQTEDSCAGEFNPLQP